MGWSHPSPTVATIVEPTERSRFDAAAQGCFAAIHAENVRDAIRTVRERPVHAVFVSPRSIVRDELAGVAALVKGVPTVTTAAVVSRHDAKSSQQLLALGASGVRRMFDLTGREGWRALRELVTHPVSPPPPPVFSRPLCRRLASPVTTAGGSSRSCYAEHRAFRQAVFWQRNCEYGPARSCHGSSGQGCLLPSGISLPPGWFTRRHCSRSRGSPLPTWRTA